MSQEINNFIQTLNSEDGVHRNTINSYKYDINQFNNFIKKKKKSFKLIIRKDILDFLESLKLKKLKNKTKNRKIFALKRFYKFLISERFIKKNPMEKIDALKSEYTLSKKLNTHQIEKILKYVSKKNKNYFDIRSNLIIELLCSTGIRVSELISIKANEVDLKNNSILIDPPELVGNAIIGKKNRKSRFVFFGESTKKVIEHYLEYREIFLEQRKNDSPWLFPSNKPEVCLTRRRILQIMQDLADKIKIDKSLMHPHSFRLSFGNYLLDNGADIKIVQKLLGHSSILTTQTYTNDRDKTFEIIEKHHPLSKNDRELIEKLHPLNKKPFKNKNNENIV